MYLAEVFPALGLSPAPGTPDRARYLRWMLFLATSVYGSSMRVYFPERYTTDPTGVPGLKADAVSRLDHEWATFASAFGDGPYLLGGTMSAADLYAGMLASWMPDLPTFHARHPNLLDLDRRLKQVPSIASVLARNDM